MSRVTDPPKKIATMTAIRDDGSHAMVVFLAWPDEPEDDAEAFELVKDGRGQIQLVSCAGKLADWRRVAELAAEMGG